MSTATIDATKMELTACRVSFGPLGTEVDLGGTLGSVKMVWKYMKSDIMADQTGKSPLDKSVSGFMCDVEFEIAQVKDKTLWAIAFPNAALVPGTGANVGKNKMVFKSNIGDKDLSHAKSLVLHPLSMLDADKSMDYNFPLAVGTAESEIVMGHDKQQMLKIKMTCYPDATGVYCTVGDPSLT